MRQFFIVVSMLTVNCTMGFAQFGGDRNPGLKHPIDTCRLRIIYEYKFVKDTVDKTPYYDRKALEIGSCYCHYYSLYADKMDSIMYNARKNRTSGRDGVAVRAGLNSNEIGEYKDIYLNYPRKGLLTSRDLIVNKEYEYEEEIPSMIWAFSSVEYDTILGYNCYKATTLFRGRLWYVWYTPEIPVTNGVWKFSGLPGAILKVNDSLGLFEWTAVAIQKPPMQLIYIHDPSLEDKSSDRKMRLVKTDRKKVMFLTKMVWEDPAGLMLAHGVQMAIHDPVTNKFLRAAKSGEIIYPYRPSLELE